MAIGRCLGAVMSKPIQGTVWESKHSFHPAPCALLFSSLFSQVSSMVELGLEGFCISYLQTDWRQ